MEHLVEKWLSSLGWLLFPSYLRPSRGSTMEELPSAGGRLLSLTGPCRTTAGMKHELQFKEAWLLTWEGEKGLSLSVRHRKSFSHHRRQCRINSSVKLSSKGLKIPLPWFSSMSQARGTDWPLRAPHDQAQRGTTVASPVTETLFYPGVAFMQPTHLGKPSDDGNVTKPDATTYKSTKNNM